MAGNLAWQEEKRKQDDCPRNRHDQSAVDAMTCRRMNTRFAHRNDNFTEGGSGTSVGRSPSNETEISCGGRESAWPEPKVFEASQKLIAELPAVSFIDWLGLGVLLM